MRKCLILLVLAVAVPAMAGNVTISSRHAGGGWVDVNYTADANVSAFALDINCSDANIVAIDSYFKGECSGGSKGYGIFPANFARHIDANNPNWNDADYTPVAAGTDPGAKGGLGTKGVTIEMGALYTTGNAPAKSGKLCRVQVDTIKGKLKIEANSTRGNIVHEGGTPATMTPSTVWVTFAVAPGAASNPSPADLAINVNRSTTVLSWAPGSGATSRDVYFGTAATPVTKVITDGTATTYNPGTMLGKKTYYWQVVEKNGAGSTAGPIWRFTTICKGDYDVSVDITTNDISLLVTYWNLNKNAFKKAPLTGPGYVVGMDLDSSGDITTNDISLLVTYWNLNKNAFKKAPCMP